MRTIDTIERLIRRIGLGAALILLPLLVLVRVSDIATRALNIQGPVYNAIESELFALFAFLIIGAACVSDAHVRVDILYERFSPRAKAMIEIVGTVVFVLPFAGIVVWYGSTMVAIAFTAGESSVIGFGTATKWLIVAATPLGIGLFAAATLCRTARAVATLAGRGPMR